jgi:hypothetical protein
VWLLRQVGRQETFYSQVPILYGDYIAKIAVAPVSVRLTGRWVP